MIKAQFSWVESSRVELSWVESSWVELRWWGFSAVRDGLWCVIISFEFQPKTVHVYALI